MIVQEYAVRGHELGKVPPRALHGTDGRQHAALARAHDEDVVRLRAVGNDDLAVPAVVHVALAGVAQQLHQWPVLHPLLLAQEPHVGRDLLTGGERVNCNVRSRRSRRRRNSSHRSVRYSYGVWEEMFQRRG